ncbi:interferon phi 3 [Lates calcarifer]|uniref:Interferon phi 3 n=1 Tax=Lates calcarifer TaxID=8187 RepID=A0A4W6F0I4_LATCA|nr:interferon phi 3 [Lates calcarifer]XP_050924538.1 interferon phi 3 [Lates calcarifer]
MTPSSILFIILQLCSLQLMAVSMPTCQMQANVVKETHQALRDLGGSFPAHCLQYNVNISFPYSAFPATTAGHPHCRRASAVVYESLKGMQQIFEDELPAEEGGVNWDNTKLSTFMILQDRLLEQGSCLSTVSPNVLMSYFSNVTAVVQQENSAVCGWKALMRDVLEVLEIAQLKHETCFTRRR